MYSLLASRLSRPVAVPPPVSLLFLVVWERTQGYGALEGVMLVRAASGEAARALVLAEQGAALDTAVMEQGEAPMASTRVLAVELVGEPLTEGVVAEVRW